MTAPIVFKLKNNAVVASPNGGSGRFKNNKVVKWFNETDRRIQLRFTVFSETDDPAGPPVWLFGTTPAPQGIVFDAIAGIVLMDADCGFTAPVSAPTQPLYTKYTASALPPGQPVDPLDPIIIIDR